MQGFKHVAYVGLRVHLSFRELSLAITEFDSDISCSYFISCQKVDLAVKGENINKSCLLSWFDFIYQKEILMPVDRAYLDFSSWPNEYEVAFITLMDKWPGAHQHYPSVCLCTEQCMHLFSSIGFVI